MEQVKKLAKIIFWVAVGLLVLGLLASMVGCGKVGSVDTRPTGQKKAEELARNAGWTVKGSSWDKNHWEVAVTFVDRNGATVTAELDSTPTSSKKSKKPRAVELDEVNGQEVDLARLRSVGFPLNTLSNIRPSDVKAYVAGVTGGFQVFPATAPTTRPSATASPRPARASVPPSPVTASASRTTSSPVQADRAAPRTTVRVSTSPR